MHWLMSKKAILTFVFLSFTWSAHSQELIYRFSGIIDKRSVLAAIEAINSGIKTLVVDSNGGYEVSAIRLANVIAAFGLLSHFKNKMFANTVVV